MSTPISGIGQIAITVSDVDQALAFYRDILEPAVPVPPRPESRLPRQRRRSPDAVDATRRGARSAATPSCTSEVADIGTTFVALLNRGAVGEREPEATAELSDHTLWVAFLRDPDGNLVGLMEERRRG